MSTEMFKHNKQILEMFTVSCLEQLADIESAVLDLEGDDSSHIADGIKRIYRAVHTIKGDSGVLHLENVIALSHQIEDLLNCLEGRESAVPTEVIDAFLHAFDRLRLLVSDVEGCSGRKIDDQIARIQKAISFLEEHDFLEESIGYPEDRADDEQDFCKDDSVEEDAGVFEDVENPAGCTPKVASEVTRINVSTAQLDRLANKIGELTTTQARLRRICADQGLESLAGIVEELDGHCHTLQTYSQEMRLIPISVLFEKFRRLCRDLAAETGKDADVEIEGESTEIDLGVADHLNGPLVHLVRNAFKHGIESPEVRKQAGKPEKGKILLAARQAGREVEVSVSDDGCGVNVEAIWNQAVSSGQVDPGVNLSEDEKLNLIFRSGLSLAGKVDTIGGRGVGLDSVLNSVSALRGRVVVENRPGQGATFKFFIPISMAVVECLAVELNGGVFYIHLDDIIECLELEKNDIDKTRRKGFLRHRDSAMPVKDLSSFFGFGSSRGSEIVVVRCKGDEMAGLIVDRIIGQYPAVYKDIGKVFSQVPGVMGASITDDGSMGIVLDILGIVGG